MDINFSSGFRKTSLHVSLGIEKGSNLMIYHLIFNFTLPKHGGQKLHHWNTVNDVKMKFYHIEVMIIERTTNSHLTTVHAKKFHLFMLISGKIILLRYFRRSLKANKSLDFRFIIMTFLRLNFELLLLFLFWGPVGGNRWVSEVNHLGPWFIADEVVNRNSYWLFCVKLIFGKLFCVMGLHQK